MAQKLEIGDKVKCLGWIEQNKLTELLHSTDVLIHPSPVHEPYGVAVIEAMASGVVVLASDATCAGIDRIAHGVNGFIHPSGNTQILAEQILFLLKNPKRIEEIGRKARLTAEEWPISRGVEIVKKAI
jgi:glycosyltransferase involved in cell wall biosynthesis